MDRAKTLAISFLALTSLTTRLLAHAPVAPENDTNRAATTPLSGNYTIRFTLFSGEKKQEGEMVTAQSGISFDLVDDPDHTLRFKGQLKEADPQHVTLAYQAMLVTVVTAAGSNRQTATTSGEGAVRLEFDKPVTILSSSHQRLEIAVHRSAPSPTG